MDSYRVAVRAAMPIGLADADAEVEPVPTSGGGRLPEPALDRLSNILRVFNDQFGNIDWKDADTIRQVIAEDLPTKVAADKAYQNAMQHSDKQKPALSTTRRCSGCSLSCCLTIPNCSSSSATTQRSRSG